MKDYSFGNFICALRMRRGLSQFQLGTLVGVTDKAVSKWENGAAKPQISTCRKLADVLGVSLDELLSCKYQTSTPVGKGIFAMKKKLWNKAHSRLTEIYGSNPPVNISGRFETEKMLLKNSDLIVHFAFLSKLAEYSRQINSHLSFRAEIGNSFVAWLMGITDINPLEPHYFCDHCKNVEFQYDAADGWDLQPKKCACGHMMRGDGHRLPCERTLTQLSGEPGFDINIPPDIGAEAERLLYAHFEGAAQVARIRLIGDNHFSPIRYVVLGCSEKIPETDISWNEYMQRYFDKPRYVFCLSKYEKTVQELCRATNRTPEKIDFLSTQVVSAYERAEFPTFLEGPLKPLRPILQKFQPVCFSEILKVEGLLHSTGAWEENSTVEAEPIGEQIAFREDVFERISALMHNSRYTGNGLPLKIMVDTFCGKYTRKGMSSETESLLLNLGLPQRCIDSLKQIRYLFPRAHFISYLHTEMILMWFYIHERDTFNRITQTVFMAEKL